MSSTSSNQMKSFYKQKKKNESSIAKSKKSHSATLGSDITQPISLPFANSSEIQDERYDNKEEEVLRQFDMNMAYGPCLGMNRLQRWERASRLGLNPPNQIRTLLQSSNARSLSLWDGRI